MTVRQAMVFHEIEIADIERYITDDRYALEQKVDGTRVLCVLRKAEVGADLTFEFLTRGGEPLKHTAATQHLHKITAALDNRGWMPCEIVLDGEIMIDTGEFVVFDLPYFRENDLLRVMPDDTYRRRITVLSEILFPVPRPVRKAYTAADTDMKRNLFEAVRDGNGEGVMLKDLLAPYEPGKRVRHSVKVKFVKTADVVVTASSRGRNLAGRETGAFDFAVYDWKEDEEGTNRRYLKPLGSCSAIGKPETHAGDVIEIAYLYRGSNGSPVQPRMLRVRDDKRPDECTLDQFPIYSKAVL